MLSNILNLSVVALGIVGVASAANILDIRDWQNKALDIDFSVNVDYNVVLSWVPTAGNNQKVSLLSSLQ